MSVLGEGTLLNTEGLSTLATIKSTSISLLSGVRANGKIVSFSPLIISAAFGTFSRNNAEFIGGEFGSKTFGEKSSVPADAIGAIIDDKVNKP